MKFYGLTVSSDADAPAPRSLGYSFLYGTLSFAAVSAAAYSIWAFRLLRQEATLYAAIAIVYLGLGGLALSRLVVAPGAWKRFPALFASAFFLYALGWCACWFGLRGKHLADLWGALAGLAAMVWLFQSAFGTRPGFLRLLLVLFVCHSAGYYLGGELYAQFRGSTGRLLWGVAHGLGFGAGLGYVLHMLQRAPTRASSPDTVSLERR
jgi:hypothetical protein